MAKITFAYWDIPGLAEPIRLLLHYRKVAFEDKRYAFDSGEWQKDKFNLDLDFPNIPYLLDGDVKLSQSTTILRYLGKKYKLEGNTEEEKLKVSLLEQQVSDIRWMLLPAVVEPDLEKARSEIAGKSLPALELLEKFLGDRDFLVGDNVTYVDFLACVTLDFYQYCAPEVIRKLPTLKAYRDRIKSLPELQDYLNSSTYKRWPIFAPIAKFGGSGEEPSRD